MRTLLLLGLLLALLGNHPAAHAGTADCPAQACAFLPIVLMSTPPPPIFAEQVIALVNQQRALVGCAPLTADPRIGAAAQSFAEEMALGDFFSHTGQDGSQAWDRLTSAGYQWTGVAENIAAGQPTPADVVAAWMTSPGHRDNILNCALHDTGVGYYLLVPDTGAVNYRHYWVQDFGAQ